MIDNAFDAMTSPSGSADLLLTLSSQISMANEHAGQQMTRASRHVHLAMGVPLGQ